MAWEAAIAAIIPIVMEAMKPPEPMGPPPDRPGAGGGGAPQYQPTAMQQIGNRAPQGQRMSDFWDMDMAQPSAAPVMPAAVSAPPPGASTQAVTPAPTASPSAPTTPQPKTPAPQGGGDMWGNIAKAAGAAQSITGMMGSPQMAPPPPMPTPSAFQYTPTVMDQQRRLREIYG